MVVVKEGMEFYCDDFYTFLCGGARGYWVWVCVCLRVCPKRGRVPGDDPVFFMGV